MREEIMEEEILLEDQVEDGASYLVVNQRDTEFGLPVLTVALALDGRGDLDASIKETPLLENQAIYIRLDEHARLLLKARRGE